MPCVTDTYAYIKQDATSAQHVRRISGAVVRSNQPRGCNEPILYGRYGHSPGFEFRHVDGLAVPYDSNPAITGRASAGAHHR